VSSGAEGSVNVSAGRYDSDPSFEPQPEPEFSFEIELISGEEGRELRLDQARAIRELLLWSQSRRARSYGSSRRKSPDPEVKRDVI
jgi:hypothetical protein